MVHDETDGELPDLSNRDILRILMQEIADTRYELKGDMADLKQELKADIQALDQKLSSRIDAVDRKLTLKIDAVSLKSDRNHVAFMTNIREVDGRVVVLEGK